MVYGTIIGVLGKQHPYFGGDLINQVNDYKRLSAEEHNLCICGDFNCSFSDNYYFTNVGRRFILQSFEENRIELLTASRPFCIDHIAISKQFIVGSGIQIEEWNQEKRRSDHKGIAVEFI